VRRRVLVVGTGLTAVDLALSLTREDRPVAMVSRHGWLPAAHTSRPARGFVAALVAESWASTGDWRPAARLVRAA